MVKYRIQKDADAPIPKRGRRGRWELPLEDIGPTDVLNIEYSPIEARDNINAVRSHVSREQKKLGIKFSVVICDTGIAIFQRPDHQEEGEENDGLDG